MKQKLSKTQVKKNEIKLMKAVKGIYIVPADN